MEFLSTLDDKGRISLPARIRSNLHSSKLILTKGDNRSILVILPEDWDAFETDVLAKATTFTESMLLQRMFISPMVELETDKAGRIAIPQSLREYAKLTKECKILEKRKGFEIWDTTSYDAYWDANAAKLDELMNRMGALDFFK